MTKGCEDTTAAGRGPRHGGLGTSSDIASSVARRPAAVPSRGWKNLGFYFKGTLEIVSNVGSKAEPVLTGVYFYEIFVRVDPFYGYAWGKFACTPKFEPCQ